jgi:hypothetical protein
MTRKNKIERLIKAMEAKKEHNWCQEEQLKLEGLYELLTTNINIKCAAKEGLCNQ